MFKKKFSKIIANPFNVIYDCKSLCCNEELAIACHAIREVWVNCWSPEAPKVNVYNGLLAKAAAHFATAWFAFCFFYIPRDGLGIVNKYLMLCLEILVAFQT